MLIQPTARGKPRSAISLSRPKWLKRIWRDDDDTNEPKSASQDPVGAAADAARLGSSSGRRAGARRRRGRTIVRAGFRRDDAGAAGSHGLCRPDREGET